MSHWASRDSPKQKLNTKTLDAETWLQNYYNYIVLQKIKYSVCAEHCQQNVQRYFTVSTAIADFSCILIAAQSVAGMTTSACHLRCCQRLRFVKMKTEQTQLSYRGALPCDLLSLFANTILACMCWIKTHRATCRWKSICYWVLHNIALLCIVAMLLSHPTLLKSLTWIPIMTALRLQCFLCTNMPSDFFL